MAKKVIDIEIRSNTRAVRETVAEAKRLQEQLEKATDPEQIKRLNKELDGTKDELKSLNDEANKFNLDKKFDDLYQETAPLSSRLGELEDRMYELAFAGQANSEEFRTLQAEAIEMRQTIIQVDKQVDILADNRGFSVFGDGLAEVGSSLMRMDFETASQQAATLAANAGKISFGTAVKSVKQFGSTLINLGKAILANPVFLLVSIIVALGVAIYELLDSLGVIKVVFEAVGDAIGWVVQQIKDFLDFLGLTSFAEQDAAEKSAQAAEKRAAAYENASKRIVQSLDTEIKMAQLLGKDTEELERERLKQIISNSEAQLKASRERYRAEAIKKELDNEEMRALRQKITDTRLERQKALDDLKIFNLKVKVEREKAIKEEKQELEKQSQEQQKQREQNFRDYLTYQQKRIDAQRQMQDIELALLEEGYDKELKSVQLQFDRLIEDTKRNENLKQSERLKLIELYNQQRLQAEEKAYDAEVKRDEERKKKEEQEAQKELDQIVAWNSKRYALQIELMQEGSEKEKAERIKQFEDRITKLQEEGLLTNEIQVQLEEQLQADLKAIKEKADKEDEEREKKKAEDKKNLEIAKAQMAIDGLALVSGAAELFASKSERAAKVAFNIQKAASIAQATMDGYKAVISAYANAPGGPVLKSIAAAIAGGFSAVQIAGIAKTRFEGGGGASGVQSSASGGGALSSPAASAQTPNLQLFGQANGLNTFFQPESEEQTQTIQAVVSLDQLDTSKDKQAQIFENGLL